MGFAFGRDDDDAEAVAWCVNIDLVDVLLVVNPDVCIQDESRQFCDVNSVSRTHPAIICHEIGDRAGNPVSRRQFP